jgi:uncharacterized protein with GYD domain
MMEISTDATGLLQLIRDCKEVTMPVYILLSTLTPEGRQTLHKDPDRMEKVNREIADFGCKVIAQYAVLGQCDFVTIIEAADNAMVAHLSVDLGSRGTVNIMTLPAIPLAELRDKMKGPKQMGRA